MRPIRNCLNRQLSELCQRSMQLEELSLKVAQLLPVELAHTCYVGSFNKGCLVLTASDAAWASQLRYAIPELRDRLRSEAGMYQLLSIKIIIGNPVKQESKPPLDTKPALSDKAKASIISESEHCLYQPLKKALLNLGSS